MYPVKPGNKQRLKRRVRFLTTWLIVASFLGVFQVYKLDQERRKSAAEYREAFARVESSLDHGEDLNALIEGQYTRLHLAVHESSPDVRPLLQLGANPNARDSWGATPLHWAARKSFPGDATALLEAGADPWATDQRGETPLDVAMEHTELLKKGASGGMDCTRDRK